MYRLHTAVRKEWSSATVPALPLGQRPFPYMTVSGEEEEEEVNTGFCGIVQEASTQADDNTK